MGGVKFDLGSLLQGQTIAAQHKSACILLLSGSRCLQCTVIVLRESKGYKSFCGDRFHLGRRLQGDTYHVY